MAPDTTEPLTVLLVDDGEQFLAAAAAWIATQPSLRLAGTARDGAEALEWLAHSRASLVLMDAFMPVMDGFEATRRIKTTENAPIVIMLSVHDGSTMEHEAWAAGADGFLAKADFASRLPDLIRALIAEAPARRSVEKAAPARRPPEELLERTGRRHGALRLAFDRLTARFRIAGNDRRPEVGIVRSLTEGGTV